ncbi:hypothetical protein [Thioalkalivibrio sp. ALE23]|uniref:hypothetical protein n=1 Tax=Thioalkalivibrio sp. ALE23 TaxID=1265495 RepID=UPI0012DC0050|nr:hypothetical protein [Thioalkalivibrio sp. ALE23]
MQTPGRGSAHLEVAMKAYRHQLGSLIWVRSINEQDRILTRHLEDMTLYVPEEEIELITFEDDEPIRDPIGTPDEQWHYGIRKLLDNTAVAYFMPSEAGIQWCRDRMGAECRTLEEALRMLARVVLRENGGRIEPGHREKVA